MRKWWYDHSWKYVVRDFDSSTVLHVTVSRRDALAYARIHLRIHPGYPIQIRRVSTWYKAGKVFGQWFLDDTDVLVDW